MTRARHAMKLAQASLWASAQAQSMHGIDGIWYASYAPGVAREIDPSRYRSLVHFFDESVARYRHQVAFASLGSELTFDALDQKAHAFASYLQEIGVQHGDHVALMMPNTLAYPVPLFGALIAGAIVLNVNPLLYTVRELAHQLKDCGAQTIVMLDLFAKTLEDALPGSRVKHVVVTSLGDLLAGGFNVKGRTLNLFVRHVKKQVPGFALPEAMTLRQAIARGAKRKLETICMGHGDIAFIQYTGGTISCRKARCSRIATSSPT